MTYIIDVHDNVFRHCPSHGTLERIFVVVDEAQGEVIMCCCRCQRVLRRVALQALPPPEPTGV